LSPLLCGFYLQINFAIVKYRSSFPTNLGINILDINDYEWDVSNRSVMRSSYLNGDKFNFSHPTFWDLKFIAQPVKFHRH